MTQFFVAPDELRGHAGQLDTYALSTQQGFDSLRSELADMEAYFTGLASTAFQGHMEEWQTSARALTTALASLGQFLNSEAASAEELDAQLAAG
ncbi:hypothetical protein DVS28_a1150 [Euzebya pacifica]|uniref:ESAT-6-like protein n=1 Tax=Euzebya pacifica TaxID=1608957 RepID=A0A346XUF3_9ACTN|nr:WXG100 family type VII secretion target [Euzebya pacifica]AXV05850.1 hypothetical protein DVS28_a1150 [Euzebya pacifica]